MNEEDITNRIASLYPEAVMELSGADCNFELYIISNEFTGINTLKRQQSILALFKDELSTGKLHALSIKAKTPDEQNMSSGLINIQL